ncbi:MAG: hypothetical protein FWH01_17810 [Oscillospiraceae bacterium]|nr:hypothetical protein [Oscillospiraceae bacterium]
MAEYEKKVRKGVIVVTVTQTAVRESLCRRILDLTDEEIDLVEGYVSDLEAHEPNEETIAAFIESENLDRLPIYDNLENMFEDFGIKIQC